jgi:hypothetical protein
MLFYADDADDADFRSATWGLSFFCVNLRDLRDTFQC